MVLKKIFRMIYPEPKQKRKIENKHMASFFFAMFITFFFMFVANRYTMNIIMAMIMLQFCIGFKTWQMIRDFEDKFIKLVEDEQQRRTD